MKNAPQFLIIIAIVCLAGGAGIATVVLSLPKHATPYSGFELEYVTQLNKERSDKGLAPLVQNAELDDAAEANVKDMIVNDYLGTTSPQGVTYRDFVVKSGYPVRYYMGASLGRKYVSGADLLHDLEQWVINDPNIFNAQATEIGIYAARAAGDPLYHVVVDYGTQKQN